MDRVSGGDGEGVVPVALEWLVDVMVTRGDKKLFGVRRAGAVGEMDRGHRGPNVDLLSLSFSFTKQGCMVTIPLERLSLDEEKRERAGTQ
jgi:hypothetical protein